MFFKKPQISGQNPAKPYLVSFSGVQFFSTIWTKSYKYLILKEKTCPVNLDKIGHCPKVTNCIRIWYK